MQTVVIGESYRVAARVMERALPKRMRARARDWPAVVEYTTAAVPVGPLAALAARRTLDAWAAVGLAQSLTSLALALWLELGELADGLPLGVLCRVECGRLRALTAAEIAGRLMVEVEDFHRLAGLLAAPGVAYLEVIQASYTYDETDPAQATTVGAPVQLTLFEQARRHGGTQAHREDDGAVFPSPPSCLRACVPPCLPEPEGCDSPTVSSASRGPPTEQRQQNQPNKQYNTKQRITTPETSGVADAATVCPSALVSECDDMLRDALDSNDIQRARQAFLRVIALRVCGGTLSERQNVTFGRLFAGLWERACRDGRPVTADLRRQRFEQVRELAALVAASDTVRDPAAYLVSELQRAGMMARARR